VSVTAVFFFPDDLSMTPYRCNPHERPRKQRTNKLGRYYQQQLPFCTIARLSLPGVPFICVFFSSNEWAKNARTRLSLTRKTYGCVGGSIVMVQEPIPNLPLFWMFSSQALTQSFQHIQVKLLIYCLPWRNKLPMHYPIKKKEINTLLTLERTCRTFFQGEFSDFD